MSLDWAGLVHERLAVIATFAYSQAPLAKLRNDRFAGSWRFLEKVIYEVPLRTATQATIELALYFRSLDDDQRLTDYWKQTKEPTVGMLYSKDAKIEPLSPREDEQQDYSR